MRAFLKALVLLAVVGGFAYVYRAEVTTFTLQAYRQIAPCSVPIAYTIGSIDPRFGISTSSVLAATEAATAIWEKAAGRDLFVYSSSTGALRIDFIYDSRQQTTQTLKKLGLTVNDDLASYNAAKARYQGMYADYTSKKAAFDAAYAAYEHEAALYQQEVNSWNSRGGAPSAEYARLQKEKENLQKQEQVIQSLQDAANSAAKNVNALATLLNHLAGVLNIDSSKYNSVGEGQGSEFEEALYQSAPGSEQILVFEFDGTARLRRVLAHEFGHALGLEHVNDVASIMYRLNQSTNELPTAADRAELDAVCRIK